MTYNMTGLYEHLTCCPKLTNSQLITANRKHQKLKISKTSELKQKPCWLVIDHQ